MYKVTLLTLILAKVLQSEYRNIYMNMISEEECTFVQSQWCGWYSHWVTLEIINIVSSLAGAAVSESLWSGDSEQGWSSNWSTQLLIVTATAAAPLNSTINNCYGKAVCVVTSWSSRLSECHQRFSDSDDPRNSSFMIMKCHSFVKSDYFISFYLDGSGYYSSSSIQLKITNNSCILL